MIKKTDIELLISTSFEQINGSSLVLLLMKVYSVLYLSNGAPSDCSKCLRNYHDEIKKTGLNKFEKLGNMKKTNICKNKGLLYVPIHGHFNLELLTDEKAILLLNLGWLKESDFDKLPESFKKESKNDEVSKIENEEIVKDIAKKQSFRKEEKKEKRKYNKK